MSISPEITINSLKSIYLNFECTFFCQRGHRTPRPAWIHPELFEVGIRIGVFAQGQILCISPNDYIISNFLFSQNGCRRPFWMTENHFQSHFSPFQINTQLRFFFSTKWRAFCLTEIHFRSHFRSIRNFFGLETFFSKCPPAAILFGSPIWAILDDRKSLSIAILVISDQYTTFF